MLNNTHHVLVSPRGGWSVKRGGAIRATKVFKTKSAAESYARELSEREKSELVIHRRDGTVEQKYVPEKDPASPRPVP